MLSWLVKPYPFIIQPSIQLALSMLIGLISFLFLLVFRPFGLEQVEDITYIFGFGFIAFIILLIHYFLFPRILTNYFNEEHWTIWKQLLFFISIVLLIGTGIYFYNSTIGFEISPQYGLGKFIYIAFAVGILPIIFMTYFIEKVAARRNIDLAESIEIVRSEKEENSIIIKSENQNEEDIKLRISDFIFAKANGNYTEITFLGNDKVNSCLMRISLKGVQDQLGAENTILRCHKSYLVNKSHIKSVEGNARSIMLKLKGIEKQIPVSRSISKSAFK